MNYLNKRVTFNTSIPAWQTVALAKIARMRDKSTSRLLSEIVEEWMEGEARAQGLDLDEFRPSGV